MPRCACAAEWTQHVERPHRRRASRERASGCDAPQINTVALDSEARSVRGLGSSVNAAARPLLAKRAMVGEYPGRKWRY